MHWAYRSTGDLCGSRLDNGHKKSAILRFLTCGTSVLSRVVAGFGAVRRERVIALRWGVESSVVLRGRAIV